MHDYDSFVGMSFRRHELLVANADGQMVTIINVKTGLFVEPFSSYSISGALCFVSLQLTGRLSNIAFAGNSTRLVVTDESRVAVVRRVSGSVRASERIESDIKSLVVSPDGRFAYTGAYDGRVMKWELDTCRVLWCTHLNSFAHSLLINGSRLFASLHDTVVVIDEDNGHIRHEIPGQFAAQSMAIMSQGFE